MLVVLFHSGCLGDTCSPSFPPRSLLIVHILSALKHDYTILLGVHVPMVGRRMTSMRQRGTFRSFRNCVLFAYVIFFFVIY